MTETRVLVVGYGSIGARHTRLLTDIGCNVAVVSSRGINISQKYSSLQIAMLRHRPKLIIVANKTSEHYNVVSQLANEGYSGDVLVEKPIFDKHIQIPDNCFRELRVAYNLRFHPMIGRLRELLVNQNVTSVQAYVGQYLPDWRPHIDYRLSYSAKADQGGGVLLDLSHEIDYLAWIFGSWRRIAAIGGRMSKLEITSDDVFSLLYETERCPIINLQLNYLDRLGRRLVIINTAYHTYEVDFFSSRLKVDNAEIFFPNDRDISYRAMHAAMLFGDPVNVCTAQEALETLAFCAVARDAAINGKWNKKKF